MDRTRRFVIVAFVLSASAVVVNAQASRTAPTEAQIKGEIVKQVGVEATVTFTPGASDVLHAVRQE